MSYVNIFGQPIDLRAISTVLHTKKSAPAEPKHKGFIVTGVSPDQIAEAKEQHSKRGEVFNEAEWIRNAKPQKLTKKPFETNDGASTCQSLAERHGWVRVTIRALTSGVK